MLRSELWEKLQSYEFDDPKAQMTFSKKLAKEQGWTKAYTKRAIDEYRRFVYLSQISQSPVTPSKPVDAVWHLHMTYTRNYWETLCQSVLGRALHHDPGRGRKDDAQLRQQYQYTLNLYREEFNADPPSEYWGSGRRSFAFWVKNGAAICILALLCFSYFRAADWGEFIVLACICLAMWLAIVFVFRKNRKIRGHSSCNTGISACHASSGGRESADAGADCGASCGGGD